MNPEIQNELRAAFFNEADMLLAIFDKNLNLIDINEAGLQMFRFKREDVIGKNLSVISPDNKSAGRYDAYREVMRTGKSFTIDEMKPYPSLGNMYFRIKAFKVGDGLALMSKDITDFRETVDDLETFIYKSSHDMRAPIASIIGLLSLVNESTSPDEIKLYHSKVKEQAVHLDSILKVLVETARIKEGTKTIQLIDFNKKINQVLTSLQFAEGFAKMNFEISVTVKQAFYCDKLLVISLFQNLIDNAIKYRKEGEKKPSVKISVADENGGVKIIVSDNGIGIPELLQKDVFKMFFRGTDQAYGSGLGLYTVNHTIKKLGGHIELVSKEKTGTTFSVYLPNEKPIH